MTDERAPSVRDALAELLAAEANLIEGDFKEPSYTNAKRYRVAVERANAALATAPAESPELHPDDAATGLRFFAINYRRECADMACADEGIEEVERAANLIEQQATELRRLRSASPNAAPAGDTEQRGCLSGAETPTTAIEHPTGRGRDDAGTGLEPLGHSTNAAPAGEPLIEMHGDRQSPPSGETATDAHSMGQAMTQVLNGARSLPEHLRRNYFTGLATIAISIMHGTYGRKFTAGFLRGATESLDDPTAVAFREPSKQ